MKKINLIIVLIMFLFTVNSANAVVETSAYDNGTIEMFEKYFKPYEPPTQEQLEDELLEKQKNEKDDLLGNYNKSSGTLAPIKRLRMKYHYWQKHKSDPKVAKEEKVELLPEEKNQIILNCEEMEYFADRREIEANGDVSVYFPENEVTVKADRIVYNQDANIIKAFENVRIIKSTGEIDGDYLKIDMNEENSFMNNPVSALYQLKIISKKGYMYGDKIIQEQGKAQLTGKTMINLNSEMFGPDLSRMFINEDDRSYLSKDEPVGRKFKIKTKELILNAKDGHDTVTLKGIDVMHKGKKIGTWPSITLHMNKEKDYVEANYPELGTTTNLGAYLGPGFVFDTPHGSILKLIPILNFNSGKFGFGGIAKFRSATNRTDIAYGTAENMLMFYGRQKLDDNLVFQYGANRFMDEGFLGFRMPRYSAELIFDKKDYVNDFLGKKRELYVNNRISAGYVQGYGDGNETFIASSGIGTSRFRYMLDLYQTLYRYENKEELKMFDIGINMQGAATVYGTGNTQFIGRVGPRMHTQYKYWMQDIAYYQTAFHDESPVVFDQYVYGGGSVYLRESLRVHKYLVISWFGTFALTNDTPNGKMMQENSFFFAFGPDDFKINIGYDTIRQQSFITMAMNLDAKGSEIKYEKMTIKNPENLKSDTSDDYLFEKEPDLKPLEKAEVINIETDENL